MLIDAATSHSNRPLRDPIILNISAERLASLNETNLFIEEEMRMEKILTQLEDAAENVHSANALALYYEYRLRQSFINFRKRQAPKFTASKAASAVAIAFERQWALANAQAIPNRNERNLAARNERIKFSKRIRKRLLRGQAIFDLCSVMKNANILYVSGKHHSWFLCHLRCSLVYIL